MPQAPPRLRPVFQKYDPPLYFVTFNTHHRKKPLANAEVHARIVDFARSAEERGMGVGRYGIMPDPFICLSETIQSLNYLSGFDC